MLSKAWFVAVLVLERYETRSYSIAMEFVGCMHCIGVAKKYLHTVKVD